MIMRTIACRPSRLPRASRVMLLAILGMVPASSWAGQVVTLVNGSKLEVEGYRMEGPGLVFSLPGRGV